MLDRVEADRSRPLGRVLDIGCGRGARTMTLAARGWTAVGMDNVPRAIAAAQARNSTDATFVIADVTALPPADLGTFDFLFDVGCLHGLDGDQLREAGRSLSAVARPGAALLSHAAQPTQSWLVPVGMSRADIEAAFADWDIVSVTPAPTEDLSRPLRRSAPQWYRLHRRPD